MKKEKWKDVVGFEGKYKVSDRGRVLSLKRKNRRRNKILSPITDSDGYYRVCLFYDGVNYIKQIHVLVALHFIPNHKNKPQVNHKKANKKNNRKENLEWATPIENIHHSIDKKLNNKCGESSHLSKLTRIQVLQIFKSEDKNKELAKKYKISYSSICRIKNGAVWSSVTKKVALGNTKKKIGV